MNRMATASLHTKGSMFTNSRCPPRSQIENVMVVLRTEIVFSMKLTPYNKKQANLDDERVVEMHNSVRTQRLYIIFVKAALDVFDHQARLSDLGVSYHADLYNDTDRGRRNESVSMQCQHDQGS